MLFSQVGMSQLKAETQINSDVALEFVRVAWVLVLVSDFLTRREKWSFEFSISPIFPHFRFPSLPMIWRKQPCHFSQDRRPEQKQLCWTFVVYWEKKKTILPSIAEPLWEVTLYTREHNCCRTCMRISVSTISMFLQTVRRMNSLER